MNTFVASTKQTCSKFIFHCLTFLTIENKTQTKKEKENVNVRFIARNLIHQLIVESISRGSLLFYAKAFSISTLANISSTLNQVRCMQTKIFPYFRIL